MFRGARAKLGAVVLCRYARAQVFDEGGQDPRQIAGGVVLGGLDRFGLKAQFSQPSNVDLDGRN